MGWNHQLDKDNHTPKLIFGVPCLWVSIWIMLFNLIFQKQLLKGSLTIESVFGKANISGTTNVKGSFRKKYRTSPYLKPTYVHRYYIREPICVLCFVSTYTCFLFDFWTHPSIFPPNTSVPICCLAQGKVQSVMSWIKDVTAEKVRRSSADRKKDPLGR